MKTILVPTDFSALSLKALDRAIELAIPAQASILLLGIVKYPEPILMDAHSEGNWNQDMDDVFEERVEGIENRLRCLLNQPKYHQVPISAIVNRQMNTIGETIASSKADLIVMASEGATGWKEKTTGSNAERVVRYAKCPVLIIKSEEPIHYQKVLFPTDFTNTQAVRTFFELADIQKAHPHFLTINTGYLDRSFDDLKEDMAELAIDLKLESYSYAIIDAVTEEAGIIRYAKEINADVIALYTHGRTGLSHWFHGSIAEKVVNHSEVPVLTLVQN